MIEDILSQNEGKTLEFKENAQSLDKIINTIVAFANTAGGKILIGIEDKTKTVVGLTDSLMDEERIASALSQLVTPLLTVDIEIVSYRKKELILIQVHHSVGPYYIKAKGLEKGTYIRLGSTNRIADSQMMQGLQLQAKNTSFDELPYVESARDALDWDAIHKVFGRVGRKINEEICISIGILSKHASKVYPTMGGILLFGKQREMIFPDAVVRCARFSGVEKVHFLDHVEIHEHLPLALDAMMDFIKKHTSIRSVIGETRRTDIPEYPTDALREAFVNALVHTDYSARGSTITVALLEDRIEIISPGGLFADMTMEMALSGFSKLRNTVIGKVFKELRLIERWGTGIKRIYESYKPYGDYVPVIKEYGTHMLVILPALTAKPKVEPKMWERKLFEYLKNNESIGAKEAATLWKINPRTSRERIKELVDRGLLQKIATSASDPYAVYVRRKTS